MDDNISNVNEEKLFQIDGITNKGIGKKIKSFSKFFIKFQIFLCVLIAIIMLFVCFSVGEEGLLSYVIILVSLIVGFVGSYFIFLIASGFGALVEDINSIKTINYKDNNKVSKKEKYEDLPKL